MISSVIATPERYRTEVIDARGTTRAAKVLAIDVVHDLAVLDVGARGITVFAVLVKDGTFSDTPRFPSELKPLSATLVPTGSVDDFGAVMLKAKRKTDEAAKKRVDP